jgi:hypothetical protein
MGWWIWVVVGILLALAEMLTPGGFYFIFFGAGALVTAGAAALGVDELFRQALIFCFVSVAALLLLRRRLLSRLDTRRLEAPVDSLIGEVAVLRATLHPGDYGKAELRGTTWQVRNVGSIAIEAGQRTVVEKVEGLTLFVRSEN